jgi:hypothetical protein
MEKGMREGLYRHGVAARKGEKMNTKTQRREDMKEIQVKKYILNHRISGDNFAWVNRLHWGFGMGIL